MATPVWQPGTIYAPGSLVQPASAIAPVPDQVTNGGFESGNTGWSLGTGFSIGEFGNGTHFQGTWSLQWDLAGTARAINTNATEVVAGQTIKANCQVQQGASDSGDAGAHVEVAWYDSSDELISFTAGNVISSGSNQHWKQSSVIATAPAGAAFARFAVSAFRNSGSHALWIDNCTWDAVVSSLPTGLVFRAVQAIAGYSASTEPVWPVVNGAQVVDNEVTWEAVFASRVVWEASPVLVSGNYEPEWPTVPNATIADGTIKWVAMTNLVTDPKAPRSKIIEIAASKIFAADDDIIAFSATVNPLDWSSEQDAGYIPFGLNTFGSTPVTAMALYRSNLVAFNSEGYQMWQVDQDPANMALLDASPLSCLFFKTPQPVMNDLVMCTPEGVRNIGIAGASTNLQAGFFGAQVDPLVLAAIQSGVIPFALFWPGAGQYWLIFGNEAFVLTMNGGNKDQSWSRYVFPEDLTYWAILDGALYLRAGSLVWLVSPEAAVDDAGAISTGGTVVFTAGDLGSGWVGLATFSTGAFTEGGTLDSGTLAGYGDIIIATQTGEVDFIGVELRVPTSEVREDPQNAYWTAADITGDPSQTTLFAVDAAFAETVDGDDTIYRWFFEPGIVPQFVIGNTYTATFTPFASGGTNAPFEGYIAWPYLDFGLLGVDKMMEGFDVVASGEFSVSFGYSQRDFSLATDPYTLDGDTLVGGMVPMPLTAPSFQLRLTFSAMQSWEWQASNLYLNDLGIG